MRVLTLFLCNGTSKHREPHREREYYLFFFNHIIMEKEPVRVVDTIKHWEPHRERGYHLNLFLFFFSFLSGSFFFICNKIIIFNLNVKIMEKEPVRVLTPF